MKRRTLLQLGSKLSGLLGFSLLACGAKPSQLAASTTLTLKSSAFEPKGMIPSQYTCKGQDISPPLSWDQPPANTKSFVLFCEDPDAPLKTWVHWVIYNLPAKTRNLPANIPPKESLPDDSFQGVNDFGNIGYGGPCPPMGTHRYVFTLYALDTVLKLKPRANKSLVEAAIKNHIIAKAQLMGQYRVPN